MDLQHDPRQHRDAIDRSKLLTKRAKKLQAASQELIERSLELSHHEWQRIAAGRVCVTCHLAQAKDEFEDETPCKAS
jgi:hypothetical protein